MKTATVNEALGISPRMIVTQSALAATSERLFPVSRHRSRRIHKKLLKRFGGEFRMAPATFQVHGQIIIHPTLYKELQRRVSRAYKSGLEATI